MGLQFFDLDDATRQRMLEELESDIKTSGVYLSSHLNEVGIDRWADLLRSAAESQNDDALAEASRMAGCFKQMTMRNTSKGVISVRVPVTAPQTLSESQFNMYYIRALARRAMEEGRQLQVYRAKAVENPRPESQAMIGATLDPQAVLDVLRRTKGVEPEIGIPMPNSGLSVRLI